VAIEEMETGVYDFDIKAGATFVRWIQLYLPKVNPLDPNEVPVPFPLSGFTGKAQLRKNASAELAYEITVDVVGDGLVKISMTKDQTSAIPYGNLITDMKSKYQWALELSSPSGTVYRPLEGHVRVSPELVK